MPFKLIHLHGNSSFDQTFDRDSIITAGRGQEECDISFISIVEAYKINFEIEQTLSRVHFQLSVVGGKDQVVVSCSSSNGIRINDTIALKKDQSHSLESGDTISVRLPKIYSDFAKFFTWVFFSSSDGGFLLDGKPNWSKYHNKQDYTTPDTTTNTKIDPSHFNFIESLKKALPDYPSSSTNITRNTITNPSAAGAKVLEKYEFEGLYDENGEEIEGVATAGGGSFGNIFCLRSRLTGERCAVKYVSAAVTQSSNESELNEAVILRSFLKHKNILQILDVFEESEGVAIVAELCLYGNLSHLLLHNPQLNEDDRKKLFVQILQGVMLMHMKGIVHCDLKPLNILVSASAEATAALDKNNTKDKLTTVPSPFVLDSADQVTLKIADFGSSRRCQRGKSINRVVIGTNGYLAPEAVSYANTVENLLQVRNEYNEFMSKNRECLEKEPPRDDATRKNWVQLSAQKRTYVNLMKALQNQLVGFSHVSDVYSLGVTLFQMISKAGVTDSLATPPHRNGTSHGAPPVQFDSETESTASSQVKELIIKMLEVNPKKRITISEILVHPWLSGVEIENKDVYLELFESSLPPRCCFSTLSIPTSQQSSSSSSGDVEVLAMASQESLDEAAARLIREREEEEEGTKALLN